MAGQPSFQAAQPTATFESAQRHHQRLSDVTANPQHCVCNFVRRRCCEPRKPLTCHRPHRPLLPPLVWLLLLLPPLVWLLLLLLPLMRLLLLLLPLMRLLLLLLPLVRLLLLLLLPSGGPACW
jgi:hypothetical protein